MAGQFDKIAWDFNYHAPSEEAKLHHQAVRDHCRHVANFYMALLPDGREKSFAITKLEESMFWANAAIARQPREEG